MSTPIISASTAEHFNQEIQGILDSRLFLFCNYEPTPVIAASADGRYLIAAQDLYKFAFDSSCILKQYNDFLPKGIRSDYSRLGEILDFISELRTAIDHNRSEYNGWLDQNTLSFYKNWLQSIIGKDAADCEEDYEKLEAQLVLIANELKALIDKFISFNRTRHDKPEVVKKWIRYTLSWYSSTTKVDLYRGQLINAYIARVSGEGKTINNWDRKAMFERSNNWICNLYFSPLKEKKDAIDSDIAELKAQVEEDALKQARIKLSLSNEQMISFEEAIRKQITTLESERQEITRKTIELDQKIKAPAKYFFTQLISQLQETMAFLDTQGIAYSLLPQSLLQEDVDRVFRMIPAPEP